MAHFKGRRSGSLIGLRRLSGKTRKGARRAGGASRLSMASTSPSVATHSIGKGVSNSFLASTVTVANDREKGKEAEGGGGGGGG